MTLPRPSLKLVGMVAGLAAILLLIGCTPSHPQSTFDAAGPVAEKQRTLFYIIFWAAVAVFVLVEGVLLYAVVRYRRRWWRDAMPVQAHGNTPLEIGWTVAPAIVLAVIAVPTVIYIFDISRDPPPDALEVRVIGHQWWWEFEYTRDDLTTFLERDVGDSVVTANELYVPVDTPVHLTLVSDDVIHSFWIPKLAGKRDVVPANENPLWFEARSRDIDSLPATFFGQCAEFCGVAHAHMKIRVIVDTRDGFEAWVQNYYDIAAREQAKRRDIPTDDSLETRGFRVFQTRGCILCHKADGPATVEERRSLREAFERGDLRFPAPNLTNFGTRTSLAGAILENDPFGDNLMKWLRDPEDIKEGNRMGRMANVYVDPDARLTGEEIEALAAYLLSLK